LKQALVYLLIVVSSSALVAWKNGILCDFPGARYFPSSLIPQQEIRFLNPTSSTKANTRDDGS
jgi:hypothetical protein